MTNLDLLKLSRASCTTEQITKGGKDHSNLKKSYRKRILGTGGGGYSEEAEAGGRPLKLEDLLMEVPAEDLLVLL